MAEPAKRKITDEELLDVPNPYGFNNEPSPLGQSTGNEVRTTTFQPTESEQAVADLEGQVAADTAGGDVAPIVDEAIASAQAPAAPAAYGGPPTKIVTRFENTLAPRTPEQAAELEQTQYRKQSGIEAQEAGGDLGMAAIARYEQDKADIQKDAVQQQWAQDAQFEQKRKDAELAAWDAEDKYRTLQKEVEESKKNQGPSAYWKNKGAFSQVLAAIGSAMGAFGATVNRTENHAQKIIDTAIAQEIAAQREALDTGRQNLAHASGVYAQALRIYGDMPQAEAAARAALHESVAKTLERRQGLLKTDLETATWSNLYGQQKEKAAQAQQEIAEKKLGTQTTEIVQRTGGTGRQEDPFDRANKILDLKIKEAKLDELRNPTDKKAIDVPGIGKVKTSAAAKELADQIEGYITIGSGLDRMKSYRKEKGFQVASALPFGGGAKISPDTQQGQTIHSFTTRQIARLYEKGALSEGDNKFYSDIIRGPHEIGEVYAGWKEADNLLNARLYASAKAAGVDPKKAIALARKGRRDAAKGMMPEGARPVE